MAVPPHPCHPQGLTSCQPELQWGVGAEARGLLGAFPLCGSRFGTHRSARVFPPPSRKPLLSDAASRPAWRAAWPALAWALRGVTSTRRTLTASSPQGHPICISRKAESSSPPYLPPPIWLPTPATLLALLLEAASGCGQADRGYLRCSVTQAGLRPAASLLPIPVRQHRQRWLLLPQRQS